MLDTGDRGCAYAYTVRPARTIAELDAAAQIRWQVFSEAMQLGAGLHPPLREMNGFDVLGTTENFICYQGDEPIGTLRLLRPNPQIAAAHGVPLGLPLEIPFQVEGLPEHAMVAELGRAAIRPAHRGSLAIGRLLQAAYETSRRLGVTHWLGVGRAETDMSEDARIVASVLAACGRMTPDFRLRARSPVKPDYLPKRSFYSPWERTLAAEGVHDTMRIPYTIRFMLGIGVTLFGEPVLEPAFNEYVLPFLLPLDAYAGSAFGRRYVAELRAA